MSQREVELGVALERGGEGGGEDVRAGGHGDLVGDGGEDDPRQLSLLDLPAGGVCPVAAAARRGPGTPAPEGSASWPPRWPWRDRSGRPRGRARASARGCR